MKNSAIERTSEIFSADQVSMCRSCSRARRGPRPGTRDGPRAWAPRPLVGSVAVVASVAVVVVCCGATAGEGPVAGGTVPVAAGGGGAAGEGRVGGGRGPGPGGLRGR